MVGLDVQRIVASAIRLSSSDVVVTGHVFFWRERGYFCRGRWWLAGGINPLYPAKQGVSEPKEKGQTGILHRPAREDALRGIFRAPILLPLSDVTIPREEARESLKCTNVGGC